MPGDLALGELTLAFSFSRAIKFYLRILSSVSQPRIRRRRRQYIMPAWLPFDRLSPSLPDHCTPTSDALNQLSSAFHTCIPTPLALLSTTLGVLSIISWLFAQLPQIYKNYRLKSTAGLSIYFLVEWCLGDTTNLVGASLTGQAGWQVVVAGYYVCVDVALVSQYFWYTYYKSLLVSRKEGRDADGHLGGSQDPRGVIIGVSPSDGSLKHVRDGDRKDTLKPTKDNVKQDGVFQNTLDALKGSFQHTEKSDAVTPMPVSRYCRSSLKAPSISNKGILTLTLCTVLATASPLRPASTQSSSTNSSEFVGRMFSWTSTLLYLGSRLPQIYKNSIRHSTAGLSPTLFIAAFFGNLFYSTSLLVNPLAWSSYPPYGHHGWAGLEGSDRVMWVGLAAPFWLGAAGVLALDATIGIQFLMYGEERTTTTIEDGRGRKHWRKVSGWMRGWMPSPSPERTLEEERPLIHREVGNEYGTA